VVSFGGVNAKEGAGSSGRDEVISRVLYAKRARMTEILDRAIAKARTLSAEDQDALGAVLLSLAEEWPSRVDDLDEETRAAIREGLAQAKRGEFVPEQDIQALWKRYGL
jgi:predicted transcriptional regulator